MLMSRCTHPKPLPTFHHAAGCGLACVGLLFEYLAMLRAVGPQRWAFDELAAIAQMRFRFQVRGRKGVRLWWRRVGEWV